MCDIWKANSDKKEISSETLTRNASAFKKLGVREVVLSGGEALMHSNLWKFCAILKEHNLTITLLSTGLLLKKFAPEIVRHIDQVIVSMDGSEKIHDSIRNIPNAFSRMGEGIRELRSLRATFPVSGRCVLQRGNFFDLINTVHAARSLGLDKISFLAADVSSAAFNHPGGWTGEKASEVALSASDTIAFEAVLRRSFVELRSEYETGFIAERPSKMLRILQYYNAINQKAEYPRAVCNAPWVSAVIESDGSVLPCFFHKPYGNLAQNNLLEVINSKEARAFRANLDITENDICRRCVCSIKLPPYQRL
jgi:MoaA/NifB/PqqE/SkfB family radical SAM enzyme